VLRWALLLACAVFEYDWGPVRMESRRWEFDTTHMRKNDIANPECGQGSVDSTAPNAPNAPAPPADPAASVMVGPELTCLESDPDQWFEFPSGHMIDMVVRETVGKDTVQESVKPGVALSLRSDGAILKTVGYIHAGTQIVIPLDTIDGEQIHQTGIVVSCEMVSVREHRAEIRFSIKLNPEHYIVCWGVKMGDDGPDQTQVSASVFKVSDRMSESIDVDSERLVELGESLIAAAGSGAPKYELVTIANMIISELQS